MTERAGESLRERIAAIIGESQHGSGERMQGDPTTCSVCLRRADRMLAALADTPEPSAQWAVALLMANRRGELKQTVTVTFNARSEEEAIGYAIKRSEQEYPGYQATGGPVAIRVRSSASTPEPSAPVPDALRREVAALTQRNVYHGAHPGGTSQAEDRCTICYRSVERCSHSGCWVGKLRRALLASAPTGEPSDAPRREHDDGNLRLVCDVHGPTCGDMQNCQYARYIPSESRPHEASEPSGEPEPKETTCPHCMTDLRVQWDERGEIVSVLALGESSGDGRREALAKIDAAWPVVRQAARADAMKMLRDFGAEGHAEAVRTAAAIIDTELRALSTPTPATQEDR